MRAVELSHVSLKERIQTLDLTQSSNLCVLLEKN